MSSMNNNSLILDKNKHIGKVVYIVEGDKREHTLLCHIFKNILDYSVVQVKRGKAPFQKYESKADKNSKVYIVSAENSNIKFAQNQSGKDYLDKVFSTLFEKYNLEIFNASVYYIFDRDSESNFYSHCKNLSEILVNSKDNGIESNGLLLLNYPGIESYIKSCVDNTSEDYIETPEMLKQVVSAGKYQNNKINEACLINAGYNMLYTVNNIIDRDMSLSDIDNFSFVGNTILERENDLYLSKNIYRILSLLSVSLIDLGIIRYDNPD